MSHRTQITLTDEQYERLRAESRQTGRSLAELVRLALERSYGPHTDEDRVRALRGAFGAWDERDFDGASYVDAMRRGLGRRLAS